MSLKMTKMQNLRRLKLLKLVLILKLIEIQNEKRKCWVSEILTRRKDQGHYDNLVREMRLFDSQRFFNYHRMSIDLFDDLLEKVGPAIEKYNLSREPISMGARLSMTLRFLASGDLMISISYDYRVSKTSVSRIIAETCDAIWNLLCGKVFPKMTQRKWKAVAEQFEEKWNFMNCIGALDGKHCIVQAFPLSGSSCYNYKKSHSLVLMALCDAEYNFLVGDIGASGRFSDSGIFRNTEFGKALTEDLSRLDIPSEKHLPSTQTPAPYVVVGDAAFPLLPNLMRPFPGRSGTSALPLDKLIFNYRLSRARRVVENAFGILVAKWRIFRRPIAAKRSNVVRFIKCTVALHNWIKSKVPSFCSNGYADHEDATGQFIEGRWRREVGSNGALTDICRMGSNNSTARALTVRNNFKNYFSAVDPLPYQEHLLYRH